MIAAVLPDFITARSSTIALPFLASLRGAFSLL
jgi:hypothetical protein